MIDLFSAISISNIKNFLNNPKVPLADDRQKVHITPAGRLVLLTTAMHKKRLKKNCYAKLILDNGIYSRINKTCADRLKTMQQLALVPDIRPGDLKALHRPCFAIQFEFMLTSPWYSRDDQPLYCLENPVRKETVFRLPEMGAAGWKGEFRQAARTETRELDNKVITRLFGNANDADTNQGSSGCLRFFPSFFTKSELYVINPHSRATKAGTNPIYLETVAAGTASRFVLLYQAMDADDKTGWRTDCALVAGLVRRVFEEQGFGAKTSIGFGRAKVDRGTSPPQLTRQQLQKTKQGAIKAKGLAALASACEAKKGTSLDQINPPLPGNRVVLADRADSFDDFQGLVEVCQAIAQGEK